MFEVLRQLPRVAGRGNGGELQHWGNADCRLCFAAKAIGVFIIRLFGERIWQKVGMEADAYWVADAPNGVEIGGSGIAATLRDYGRFALFMQPGVKLE